MAGEQTYVRIPPDSTGKKIAHQAILRIEYNNLVGNHIWQQQQLYTISGSVSMTVTLFSGSSSTAHIGCHMNSKDVFDYVIPSAGDIIQYNGVTVANVVTAEYVHIPKVQISGNDEPNNSVNVDASGSMNVRFAEGPAQLDAFGKLRVSTGTCLGEYIFSNNGLPQYFSTRLCGNANISYNYSKHCIVLTSPGNVVPGSQGIDDETGLDRVCHTSDTYHHYFPGFSQLFMATIACGDDGTGKPDVIRRWGYYDDRNGAYFRLAGNEVGVVIQSDSEVLDSEQSEYKVITRTETRYYDKNDDVVNTVVGGWNGDKLDGTGDSQMILDVTDDNLYWIDIAWLGTGQIRFGIYYKGQRIVIHSEHNLNNGGKPFFSTGALPITFSVQNSSQISSDATMLVWCSTVNTEHNVDISNEGGNNLATITRSFDPTGSFENNQDYNLIGVLSPVRTISDNVYTNRQIYLPNYMEALGYHDSGVDAFFEIEVYADPIIGGGAVSFSINQDEIGLNQSTYTTPWLVPVDPENNYGGVEYYVPRQYEGSISEELRPRLWGGGKHVLASCVRGEKTVDLSGIFTNIQGGGFKNYANMGGTVDHPVGSWTVSPDTSTPTIYTAPASMGRLGHREGYPVRFYNISGTASSVLNYIENGNTEFYIRIVAIDSAELYYDMEFTQPVLTNGLTIIDNGDPDGDGAIYGRMRGQYGDQMYFVVLAKPVGPSRTPPATGNYADAGNITIHFNLGWSEVNQ